MAITRNFLQKKFWLDTGAPFYGGLFNLDFGQKMTFKISKKWKVMKLVWKESQRPELSESELIQRKSTTHGDREHFKSRMIFWALKIPELRF